MHLVVGHPEDFICATLVERLVAEGLEARLIAAPLDAPSRHALRIDHNGRASTALAWRDGVAERIDSVFLRFSGPLDPDGWDPADHGYMQAEIQATLLAWISALDCPVVNRVNAELWYRPRLPLLHWLALLRTAGLRLPETIITDSSGAIDDFRNTLEDLGIPGAILTSLARHEIWLVGADEWTGIKGLGRHGPVCLSEPHGSAQSLCVVGDTIIWDGHPSPAELAIAPRLLHFARLAGLQFVEIAVARVHGGPAVVHVDPLPRLEAFDSNAQDRIIGALTDLLVGRVHAKLAEMQP